MRRICAWCKASLDESTPEQADEPVTHGMCAACAERVLAESPRSLGAFLDSLTVPVILVDAKGRVLRANQLARARLGKSEGQIEGQPRGRVFDCINSQLPEGCGQTVRCAGCEIRQSVDFTFCTGRARHGVPARLRQCRSDGTHEAQLRVFTEKVGTVVFLRVDGL